MQADPGLRPAFAAFSCGKFGKLLDLQSLSSFPFRSYLTCPSFSVLRNFARNDGLSTSRRDTPTLAEDMRNAVA
jgi:hypothetical protein